MSGWEFWLWLNYGCYLKDDLLGFLGDGDGQQHDL